MAAARKKAAPKAEAVEATEAAVEEAVAEVAVEEVADEVVAAAPVEEELEVLAPEEGEVVAATSFADSSVVGGIKGSKTPLMTGVMYTDNLAGQTSGLDDRNALKRAYPNF